MILDSMLLLTSIINVKALIALISHHACSLPSEGWPKRNRVIQFQLGWNHMIIVLTKTLTHLVHLISILVLIRLVIGIGWIHI